MTSETMLEVEFDMMKFTQTSIHGGDHKTVKELYKVDLVGFIETPSGMRRS
jgi:hypothetical protein